MDPGNGTHFVTSVLTRVELRYKTAAPHTMAASAATLARTRTSRRPAKFT